MKRSNTFSRIRRKWLNLWWTSHACHPFILILVNVRISQLKRAGLYAVTPDPRAVTCDLEQASKRAREGALSRQAISHWAKEEVTLTLAAPSVSNRGLRRGRRARRESKIVNLAARRSGADSNCYVLLSCGWSFNRVRRASSNTRGLVPSLSPSTCVHALSRLFSSCRESPTGSINSFGESVATTMPPISVRHSSADCLRWISLACIVIATAGEWNRVRNLNRLRLNLAASKIRRVKESNRWRS